MAMNLSLSTIEVRNQERYGALFRKDSSQVPCVYLLHLLFFSQALSLLRLRPPVPFLRTCNPESVTLIPSRGNIDYTCIRLRFDLLPYIAGITNCRYKW